jgi:hypothetical protein
MIEYKVCCCNSPPEAVKLDEFAQNGWEFIGVCTIRPDDDVIHHLATMPANSKIAKIMRYTLYFKRII